MALSAASACATTGAIMVSDGCAAAVGAQYVVELATCAAACISEASQRPYAGASAMKAAEVGSNCVACEATLASCGGGDGAEEVGWLADTVSFGASSFRCAGLWLFTNTTNPSVVADIKVSLGDVCYPSACSSDDVDDLFSQADAFLAANSTLPASAVSVAPGEPTCDIFGAFVDENFPWVICAASVVLFVVSLLMSRHQCVAGYVLRYVLWFVLALDALIGIGFVVGFVILTGRASFPDYLMFATLALGIFQLLIVVLLWYGGRTGGTRCCLHFANAFAGVAAVASAAIGLLFQIGGPDMLRDKSAQQHPLYLLCVFAS